jgi:hypothetical protein
MVLCDRCKKIVEGNYLSKNKKDWICGFCKMKERPPTGKVIVKGGFFSGIFCVKAGKMDHLTNLADLVKCGWFIRKLEYRPGESHYLLTLEYYGKERCLKISDNYKGFPYLAKECRKRFCGEGGVIV